MLKVSEATQNNEFSTDVFTVEECMRGLTDDAELRHNVDWLTEVIRRFSDAAIVARSFTSVNMKSPKSTVKVDLRLNLIDSS